MRSRLFESWYKSLSNKDELAYYETSIIDEENVHNHASMILRRDNPNFNIIVSSFKETAELLGEKPH